LKKILAALLMLYCSLNYQRSLVGTQCSEENGFYTKPEQAQLKVAAGDRRTFDEEDASNP
jgi:hypothetical protein